MGWKYKCHSKQSHYKSSIIIVKILSRCTIQLPINIGKMPKANVLILWKWTDINFSELNKYDEHDIYIVIFVEWVLSFG